MPALSNPSLLTIRFDEDGDLTFVVGTKPTQDMLVDSRAVCRASLVFKRMLTGNFAEAKPTFGEWRVRLPEDNADGFAIAMGLAHAQHAHIPPNLSSKALKDVLVVTNKYDMTKILGQMAKTWAKKGSMEVEAVNSVNGWGDILFISWELGSSKVFITASRTLARVCDIDQNGDLVNANGKLLKDRPHILLPNILEHIQTRRLKIFWTIDEECLKLGTSMIEFMLPNKNSSCKFKATRRGASQNDCHNTRLGRMLTGARTLNLCEMFLPSRCARTHTCSVDHLLGQLKELRTMMMKDDRMPKGHSDCDPLGETIDRINLKIRDMKGPHFPWHVERLKAQALISNISN